MNFSWLKASWPFFFVAIYSAALIAHGHSQRAEGFAEAKAQGNTALAELRLEHAKADADRALAGERSAKEAAKSLLDEQTRSDRLSADLAEQQRKNRQTTDYLSREIARVNDLYREALDAPPRPLPACVFTAGWVRVYDEATGAAVPAATDSSGVAAPAGKTQAAEQLNSGISQSRLLAHHVQYAEQCRNTAAQLDLLIDQVSGK